MAVLAVCLLLGSLSACGGGDDGNSGSDDAATQDGADGGSASGSVDDWCRGWRDLQTARPDAGTTVPSDALNAVRAAPDEIADAAKTYADAAATMFSTGDPFGMDAPDVAEASVSLGSFYDDNCLAVGQGAEAWCGAWADFQTAIADFDGEVPQDELNAVVSDIPAEIAAAVDTYVTAATDMFSSSDHSVLGEPDVAAAESQIDAFAVTNCPAGTVDTSGSGEGGGASGSIASYGDFTIDGTTVRYSMWGVEELDSERCEPGGPGVPFGVLGYAVDDDGQPILIQDGALAGRSAGVVNATFPGEDSSSYNFAFTLNIHGPADVELFYREGRDQHPDYTVDGNSVSGSVTIADTAGDDHQVDFEITCAG